MKDPEPNAECPLCAEPVVIAPISGLRSMLGGPLYSPAARDEKIASCASHGRPPFHNQTLKATGVADETEAPAD